MTAWSCKFQKGRPVVYPNETKSFTRINSWFNRIKQLVSPRNTKNLALRAKRLITLSNMNRNTHTAQFILKAMRSMTDDFHFQTL